jgi:hypothetical protein
MTCPSCGTNNTSDRKYCGLCGQALTPPVAAPIPAPPAQTAPVAAPIPAPPGPTRPLSAPNNPAIDRAYQQAPPILAPPVLDSPPPAATDSGPTARLAPVRSAPVESQEAVPPEHNFFADAFRYALAWRPLSLLTIGFFVSTMIYFFSTIFSSVIIGAMARGGSSLDTIGAIALILTALTLLVSYVVEIIFLSATTKICYERMVNGRALRRTEAMKFAVSNGGPGIIAPFLFVLVAVVVFFVEWLIFLLGSVEGIGPLVTGIFFAPLVIINALLFFVINYAIWMALITISRGARSIGDTVRETLNLVKQSFRTRVPEILSLTLVQILIGFFAIVIVAVGFLLTAMMARWAGADVPIEGILSGRIARVIDRIVMGGSVSPGFRTSEPPIFGPLLGLLTLAGGLSLIVGMLLAFPRVFFANGCIRIYQRLVKEPPPNR